jgi:light-harvesting complex I chlorophyll a/b binding protein 1
MNRILLAFLYSGHIWHAQGAEEKPVKSLAELLFAQQPSTARFRNAGGLQRSVHTDMGDMSMRSQNGLDKFDDDPVVDASYLNDLPGISAPVNRMFDPWGLSKAPKSRINFYREAELKHGRLAMLGTLGMLVGEQRAGNGLAWADAFANSGSIGKFLAALALIEGYYAVKRIVPLSEDKELARSVVADYEPGDIGFDPLNIAPKDPAKLKEMKTKELNNGRLAMLAAVGIWSQENIEGVKVLPFHFR